MTTININSTSTKITRAEAIRYAIDHVADMPAEINEVLEKIYESFTKRPASTGESKTAKENKVLAAKMEEFVMANFDADDLEATNAKSIANGVPGITTTQKVTAVAKYCENVKPIKVKGRTFYVPSTVEVND